jgi:hypothetical protein
MSRAGFEPATSCLRVRAGTLLFNGFSDLARTNADKTAQNAATVATSGNRKVIAVPTHSDDLAALVYANRLAYVISGASPAQIEDLAVLLPKNRFCGRLSVVVCH